jgi:hypothetical protein
MLDASDNDVVLSPSGEWELWRDQMPAGHAVGQARLSLP